MPRQRVHPMYGILTIALTAVVTLLSAFSLQERLSVGTSSWQIWLFGVAIVGVILLSTIYVPKAKNRWMNKQAHKTWVLALLGSILLWGIAWVMSEFWSNWVVLVAAAALIAVAALVLTRFFLANSVNSETSDMSV